MTNNDYLLSFVTAKRIEGCSIRTLDYYTMYVSKMLSQTTKFVQDISTDDIRVFLSVFQQENNSSKVTVNNMRRILSSFFGWLENEDYIIKSPMRRIKNIRTDKTIKETLSDEKLEVLRDHCTNKRDLAIVDLLTSTGIRIGELTRINRGDVNFHERECVVLGKGGKERTVYFDGKTKVRLMSYLETRTDTNKALFVSLRSPFSRLQQGGIETRLREIGKRAGVKDVHPHKFRRTFATRAIDKGMPIEQVQALLGHVRIDTTMHYAMVNQVNVKNSHRKYIG